LTILIPSRATLYSRHIIFTLRFSRRRRLFHLMLISYISAVVSNFDSRRKRQETISSRHAQCLSPNDYSPPAAAQLSTAITAIYLITAAHCQRFTMPRWIISFIAAFAIGSLKYISGFDCLPGLLLSFTEVSVSLGVRIYCRF